MSQRETLKKIKETMSDEEIEEHFQKIDRAVDILAETIDINKISLSVAISAAGRIYVAALCQAKFEEKEAKKCLDHLYGAFKRMQKDGK